MNTAIGLNLVAFLFYFLIHFFLLLRLYIVNRKFSIKLKIVLISFLIHFLLNDLVLIFTSQILASYWISLLGLPQYVGSLGLTTFIVLLNNIKAY